MDRPPHDYAAAMAFAQQQQYGFHPQQQQQQQFPPHGPPFLSPHPSQYPFHRHLPPQPQPLHLLHHLPQQQQQPPPPISPFPPHLPPHLLPPFDHPSPPPPSFPPADPDLHKRIDKLVEYAAKNGPEFEAMIREKQQDNPAYSFLFGGEGHTYYRHRLWMATHNPAFPAPLPIPPMMTHPGPVIGPGPLGPAMYPPFYDQQMAPAPTQAYSGLGRGEYEPPFGRPFKGLSGPLPSDVAVELNGVLGSLTGTKESIKGAKMWFMQRSPFAPALAEALRDRVFGLDDAEKQLHIIFLANDILFDSLQRRINPRDLDNEALAFKPVLGSMLARVYYNPQNKDASQSRLEKIVQFWASKEVYDQETIIEFEREMKGGVPGYRSITPDVNSSLDHTGVAGMQQQAMSPGLNQWQSDKQKLSGSVDMELPEKAGGLGAAASVTQLTNSASQQMLDTARLIGSHGPVNSAAGQPLQGSSTAAAGVGDQVRPPPYPLFPPGLIPGMVKKMQIGSGVPYSPLSPFDIPTVIPPSTVSPSEILERVSKFFKEIGEVNPSEGPMKSDNVDTHDDYEQDEYEREMAVRKGGACIPPPPSLQQIDPETGMYPDGSVERRPGSSSSGRLGLGATADPNEVSQYDDVYTSYRKQRSSNYHTSMSVRTSTAR